MNTAAAQGRPTVAVIGGGLAGLATAVALGSSGVRVELFEARRSLGGRAASFRDPATGQWVDHCQHVSMGCCTNLADFCRRTGIARFFRRDRLLGRACLVSGFALAAFLIFGLAPEKPTPTRRAIASTIRREKGRNVSFI